MKRSAKSLASKRFFILISNDYNSDNLTFGKSNILMIVFISVMSNLNWIGVHQDELIKLTSFQMIIWIFKYILN